MLNVLPVERDEAIAFAETIQWFPGVKLWYISNENLIKNARHCNLLKRQGWNKGIPDYFFLIYPHVSQSGEMEGGFIELKRQKKQLKSGKLVASNGPTEEQEAFINTSDNIRGLHSKICYGATEAIDFIKSLTK